MNLSNLPWLNGPLMVSLFAVSAIFACSTRDRGDDVELDPRAQLSTPHAEPAGTLRPEAPILDADDSGSSHGAEADGPRGGEASQP